MERMAREESARAQSQPGEVVILTVIPPELEAARRVLQISDDSREKAPDGTVYFHGAVRSALAKRDYAVTLTCIGGAGNPGTAAATSAAIVRYRPRAVLLMGIAAGVREKIRIGDVVLSDRVVAYEPAAMFPSMGGTTEQPRPEIDRAPHTMIQDVVSYRPEPRRLRDAFMRAGGEIPTAPPGRPDEFRAYVASSITVRQATIASGEKLLRDPAKLLAVRGLHGKTEVGEMEAAGLVDACRRAAVPVPWLVIRGISDFGDELKDDRFHAFASCAAAAVLHDFLAHGLDLGCAGSPNHLGQARAPDSSRTRETVDGSIGLSASRSRVLPKVKAVAVLRSSLEKLHDSVGGTCSDEGFLRWRKGCEATLRNLFGPASHQVTDFRKINFTPLAYIRATAHADDRAAMKEGIGNASALIEACISEVETFWLDDDDPTTSGVRPLDCEPPTEVIARRKSVELTDTQLRELRNAYAAWLPAVRRWLKSLVYGMKFEVTRNP
jgi:nucleoside phosphorylase